MMNRQSKTVFLSRYALSLPLLICLLVYSGSKVFAQEKPSAETTELAVLSKHEQWVQEHMSERDKMLAWKKLPNGLWQNKNGEIGFDTMKARENGPIGVDFITSGSDDKPFKDIIDLESFHALGGYFYKDKNHIYHDYPMAGGGNFYPLDSVDYASFEVIDNSCFVRDKNGIYTERHLDIVEADRASFEVIKGCLAKDKEGYLIWDGRVSEEEAKEYQEALRAQ